VTGGWPTEHCCTPLQPNSPLGESVLLVAEFSNQLKIVRILAVTNVIVDLLEFFDPKAHGGCLDGGQIVAALGESLGNNLASSGGNSSRSSASTSTCGSQELDEFVTHLHRQFSLLVHDETLAEELNALVMGNVVQGDLGHRLEMLRWREDAALAFAGHGRSERKISKSD